MIVAPYEQRTIETSNHMTDTAGKYRFTIPAEQVAQGHLFIEVEALSRLCRAKGWLRVQHDPPQRATRSAALF